MIAWIRKNIIIGIFAAATSAALIAWLTGFVNSILTTFGAPSQFACTFLNSASLMVDYVRGGKKHNNFRIILAQLENDDSANQDREFVGRVFLGSGIDVVKTCETFSIPSSQDEKNALIVRGRALLHRQAADILILGRVWSKDELIDLYFISDSAVPNYYRSEPYRVANHFISDEFANAAAKEVIAVALANFDKLQKGNHTLVQEALTVVDRLKSLIAAPPAGYRQDQLSDLNHALGALLSGIGISINDRSYLVEAIECLKNALVNRRRDERPTDWAMTQLFLSRSLLGLGEIDHDSALMQDGVSAAQSALTIYTPDRYLSQWCAAEINIGTAQLDSALRIHNIFQAQRKSAISIFKYALEKCSRDNDPTDWRQLNYRLGLALLEIGELGSVNLTSTGRIVEDRSDYLKEAALSFNKTLEILTPDDQDYSLAQFELGVTLTELAKIEKSGNSLREASRAFQNAIAGCSKFNPCEVLSSAMQMLKEAEKELAKTPAKQ